MDENEIECRYKNNNTQTNIGGRICGLSLFVVFTIIWFSVSMYNLFHHTSEILISILTCIGAMTTPISLYNIFITNSYGYLSIQVIIICLSIIIVNNKQLVYVPVDMCVMFIFTSVIAVFTLFRSLVLINN